VREALEDCMVRPEDVHVSTDVIKGLVVKTDRDEVGSLATFRQCEHAVAYACLCAHLGEGGGNSPRCRLPCLGASLAIREDGSLV
jgi:hypothetical protein